MFLEFLGMFDVGMVSVRIIKQIECNENLVNLTKHNTSSVKVFHN